MRRYLLILFSILLLAPICAPAGEVNDTGGSETSTAPETAGTSQQSRRPFEFGASAERVFDSGISDTDASFAYSEVAAHFEMLFLFFNADHRIYDWEQSTDFAPAADKDPWDSLTRITPGLQYVKTFGRWGVWGEFAFSAGFEDGITSDAWTYNPQLLGFYTANKDLTVYFGAGWLYHPVASLFYPVFGLAFRHEEKSGLAGAVGFPETMVRYWFTEKWAAKLDFVWDIRTYRLSDDNPVSPSGYLQLDEKIPGLYIEYCPQKDLTIGSGVRWHLDRTMTVFDRDGDELDEHTVKAGLSVLLAVNFLF